MANSVAAYQESGFDLPDKVLMKVDQTADLLTVFSGHVTVKFKSRNGESTEEKGRWCLICK